MTNLADYVRDVPDFPKEGIVFKDITPLLGDGHALRMTISRLRELSEGLGVERIVGIESRGFIFGVPLAVDLGVGFTPVRKPGKLPWKTQSQSYDLEYGRDTLEVHEDGGALVCRCPRDVVHARSLAWSRWADEGRRVAT